jgi:hypothetical protein
VLGDERGRSVKDRVSDLAPMRLDRLGPQFRHGSSIRGDLAGTV